MISQILAVILIAAVVVLLTWVYQRFHGQVPATPHPTLVSPTSSIQASQSGNPVPEPTSDKETSLEETQDEAGPKVSAHHEDIARPAATLKTDDYENSQQQQQADSQTPKAISPTHGSLEMDAVPLQPRRRVVAESDPNQHLQSARGELQEEESLPLAASGDFALPQNQSQLHTNLDTISLDAEATANQYLDQYPSQHMTELKDPAYAGEEISQTDSTTMSRGAVSREPGASLAASAGAAVSTIPRDNSPAPQLYRQQGSISQDTEPTARQHLGPGHEGRVSLPTQRSRLRLQEPPPSWRFDDLLTDLNSMITTDELDILKDKFQSCLRKKATGEIKSPRDLFIQMKQREFLNANDIIYLQAILMKLGRRDLITRTMDYCLQAGNVLHFHPATGTPENGYRYVKIHLYLDKEYSRDDLTNLQFRVANILCCPSEFVHLPAVEPSESLLVTIMLPEMYVDILVTNLDKNHLLDRFAALGIDTVTIDEKVYEIEVYPKPVARRSDEQLLSLYYQLSNRDLQIEGMENTCDQLQQKIQRLEAQEEANTAQLVESDKKRKQLMAKFEMLENKMESKATLIEELEKQCKQLEQKVEQFEQGNRKLQDSKEVLLQDIDFFSNENISLTNKIQETDRQLQRYREMLEVQEEAKTAQLAESDKKRKQLMAKFEMLENKMESKATMIEELEKQCKQLEQKVEQFEQGNRKLQDSKEVLLQDIDFFSNENISLTNKIQETDRQLQRYREMLEVQEEAKTAQLAESDKKRKQLMAKVEMLENKVASKATLIEESEQKIKDLEKQGASSNALVLKNQTECQQRIIKSLENRITKLDQLNRELKDSKEVLLQNIDLFREEINSLNNNIQETDKEMHEYKFVVENINDYI